MTDTNMRHPSPIDELANSYVKEVVDNSPEYVTFLGFGAADEGEFSDLSPRGLQEDADRIRTTLAKLEKLEPRDEVDTITKLAMTDSLGTELEYFERGEIGDINVISTPLQSLYQIYDNMDAASEAGKDNMVRRLNNTGKALAGWKETLSARLQGQPLAAKQIELAIAEAKKVAGDSSPLLRLNKLGEEFAPAVASAQRAYAELADFLSTEALPRGAAHEAFGAERYELRIRSAVGARLDLDETYEWGLAELDRIVGAQEEIARDRYGSGVCVREAMERLDADPNYQLHGTRALQEWMQQTSDQALNDLHGTHFDIPNKLRKLECMIAPSGTGAIYYTGPSDDFSRGGRMWWSVPDGTDVFHTWQEKTTVYHEGVPGHHLQVGMATYVKDTLNDWRRHLSWNSGHGEGWALYAEGLMAELGYHDDNADYMGVLDAERLRAARVVLDIGFHLGKPAPKEYQHISKNWSREVAWQFLQDNVAMDRSFLEFELNRYLGWAGQAPSYKVGHRIWKQLRQAAQEREGANFSLRDWHMKALEMGSVGLDVLRKAGL